MKSNSSIYPEKFFKTQGEIWIVDLSTVEQSITSTDDLENPQESTTYSYECYPLPIADRDSLMEYVESNYDILIEFAKVKQSERERLEKSPSETDRIWDTLNYLVNL